MGGIKHGYGYHDLHFRVQKVILCFPPLRPRVMQATNFLRIERALTPFNQAIMYLRLKGTLVCVGMRDGNTLLNIPVALLIAKV
jgi:hypothetical protein